MKETTLSKTMNKKKRYIVGVRSYKTAVESAKGVKLMVRKPSSRKVHSRDQSWIRYGQ